MPDYRANKEEKKYLYVSDSVIQTFLALTCSSVMQITMTYPISICPFMNTSSLSQQNRQRKYRVLNRDLIPHNQPQISKFTRPSDNSSEQGSSSLITIISRDMIGSLGSTYISNAAIYRQSSLGCVRGQIETRSCW